MRRQAAGRPRGKVADAEDRPPTGERSLADGRGSLADGRGSLADGNGSLADGRRGPKF